MVETTNVLITGTNRGIGKALLAIYLSRPNHIVIAGVRDPSNPTSQSLNSLPAASGTKLILTKIDSSIDTDASTAIKSLQSEHNIKHLDLVIANAGVNDYYGPTLAMPVEEWSKTFQINTIAPFLLFQATYPLLQEGLKIKKQLGKFVFISSGYGSVANAANQYPFDCAQYGASKAAMNFIARRLHAEVEDVCVFPAHPGWLKTDMGNESAKIQSVEHMLSDVEEATKGLVEQIDGATREKSGGEFVVFDGSTHVW